MSGIALSQSNSLTVLAARILAEHDAVRGLLKDTVVRAMAAGDLLIEAKRQLEHGQWLPWLRDHVKISEREAQRYMRLARNRAVTEAKNDTVSDLTLNGALALLTTPQVAEKALAIAETTESIQEKAEKARRDVLLEAMKANTAAIMSMHDEWVPKEWERKRDDKDDPELIEVRKFFDDLLEDGLILGREYGLAVECGDYDRAYRIADWFLDVSADCRSMCEEIQAVARKRLAEREAAKS